MELEMCNGEVQFPWLWTPKSILFWFPSIAGQLNGVDISNLVCDTNDEIEEFMRKFGCEDLLTWKESKEEQKVEDVFADLYRVS